MAAPRNDLPSLIDESTAAAPRAAVKREGSPGSRDRKQLFLGAGAVLILIISAVVLASTLGGGNAEAEASRRRVVIDAQSNEVFEEFRVPEGSAYPLRNPKTGADTLYPAEACFWNRDGTAKLKPTYVFVRAYLGESGETKCPDCGRKVVTHNPMPPDDLMVAALERQQQSGN